MPQVDPCCFPILHPRGTQGFQFYIKKKGKETKRKDPVVEEQLRMQRTLDISFEADNIPFDDTLPMQNVLDDLLDEYENENVDLNVDRGNEDLASPQVGGPLNEGDEEEEDNIQLNNVSKSFFIYLLNIG